MGSIKFGYLRKSELEYEVRIRGDEPMSTVAELRKQINKLYKLYPHDSIDDSTIETEEDISGARTTLSELSIMPLISDTDLERATTILCHLENRYQRIHPTSTSAKDKVTKDLAELVKITEKLNAIKCKSQPTITTPSVEHSDPFDRYETKAHTLTDTTLPIHCSENRITNDLLKHRYDGSSCVRSFLQKIDYLGVYLKLNY